MTAKFTNPLENIKIASPCDANWEEMYGSERLRFCGACKLNVYNFSEMTRREAENLILQTEGNLCVRFYRRADGSVLTADCPVGWQAIKRRVSKIATAFASFFFAAFGSMGFANYFAESGIETREMGKMTMGESSLEIKEKPSTKNAYSTKSGKQIAVAGGITNVNDVRTQIKNRER